MHGASALLASIQARAAQLGDDALAALANRGLLRRARKDLEAAAPVVLGEEGDTVRVQVEDAVVLLREDLQRSTCSCPAGRACRHVLAALMALAQAALAEAPAETPAGDPLDEMLALDDDALTAWAGRPMLRKALRRIAQGLSAARDGGVITLPDLNITCRWLPGHGPEGMLCSCHAPVVCEHRVCAVLAMQVGAGTRRVEAEVRALGASPGAPRTREEVLASLGSALRELVAAGAGRLSASMVDRLRTLAVSAHGVELPRLERLVRALADEAADFLARHAQADVRNLLHASARAEALRMALAHPTPALVGEHRSTYVRVGELRLLGMGARQWRTRSGYAGLTVYFWDPAAGRWATWTEARAATLGDFIPADRFRQDGPWEGCASPAEAARAMVRLTGAYRNPAGRLSGRPGIQAMLMGAVDPRQGPPAIRDWACLVEPVAAVYAEGFGARREMADLVVLAPERWGDMHYDDVHQQAIRPVYDVGGRELLVVLPNTPERADAIPALERFAPADAYGLLGQVRLLEDRIVVEPITLYGAAGPRHLTLDAAPSPKAATPQIRGAVEEEDAEEDALDAASATPVGRLLAALAAEMEALADGGVAAGYDLARLRRATAQADSLALACCAAPTALLIARLDETRRTPGADPIPPAGALLHAYYACRAAATHEAILTAAARMGG